MKVGRRGDLSDPQANHLRLRFLSEFSRRLLTVSSPREFVRQIFEPLSEHLGVEVYVNYLVSENGSHLELDSCSGIAEEYLSSLAWLELGDFVCGTAALRRSPIIVEEVQERDDRMTELIRELGITAYACHPLIADARLVGTLSFGSRVRERFTAAEVELMRTACDQVAAAIDRVRLIDQLREHARRLTEADERKDRFLAMLAHELRNPLAPILTATGLLDAGVDEEVSARARQIIRRQTQHMARLIDDLLEVSRITRGKITIEKKPTDLVEVVDSAAQVCASLFDTREQEMEVVAGEATMVLGDAARLEQVVVNLLINASKYSPDQARVSLSLKREDAQAVIRVRDRGIGMPPETLARIFEMFYQADESSDRAGGGLGIGLTLVRSLVDLHGGQVVARSDGPGLGSEIEVRLPAMAATKPVAVAPRRDRDVDLSRLVVLLIEDNPDAAEMLKLALEMRGSRVFVAGDGTRGLELAAQVRPDLAIVDLGLPGLEGVEVGRRLREQYDGDDLALIALSGYARPEDRTRTERAGFDAHLAKPADTEMLQQAILEIRTRGR